MAIMILKRMPTQDDLDPHHLELESFAEEFNRCSSGGLNAKVNFRGGYVYLGGVRDGWSFKHDPNSGWYSLQQDGGHPI
ncbi:hypothetical protein A7X86_06360 [Stenotrophomonas maltophilia]|nr:hypothetical protein A7X86_06360 [Stenotrophomonas maltophilia]